MATDFNWITPEDDKIIREHLKMDGNGVYVSDKRKIQLLEKPMAETMIYKKSIHHLRSRDRNLLKSLIQSVTGEDITGQIVINLSQGGINSVESTQMVKDKD